MKAGESGASPSRTPGGRGASTARGPATRSAGGGKRPGAGVSPGPRGSPGPGRTPQTKRRELSLTVAATDKNSPTGSPRSRGEEGRGSMRRGGGEPPRRKKPEEKETEGSRKSSNSSQDSGVGREGVKVASRREAGRRQLVNRGASPEVSEERGEKEARGGREEKEERGEREEREVGERQKFGELSDVTNIEMGIVRVPRELLEELIHLEPIEKYYTVDPVPVARWGLHHALHLTLQHHRLHHTTVGPTSGEKGRLFQLFPKCFMAFPYVGLIFNTS